MSTRSILINFPGYPNEPFNFMPDNGLANLAACLKAKGHDTVIWDCMTVDIIKKLYPYEHSERFQEIISKIMDSIKRGKEADTDDLEKYYHLNNNIAELKKIRIRGIGKEIAEFIAKNKFDFAGMKLWTGGGFTGAMIIAEEIKKRNPDMPIFAGGPHIDWFMEQIFDVTNIFDVLVYGEGEEVITMLADYVEGKTKLEQIQNLIYKKNGRIITTQSKAVSDLDTLPSPIYDEDVYPAMKGNQKIKAMLIEESRGCPNSCNFCIHPAKSGRKRRCVSAKKLVDEIERAINKYNVHAFRLAGSNPPATHLSEIAREITKRGLKIKYATYAHVKGFKKEDFDLLKKSGCCAIAFGVESGSQKILDESLNKRIKVSEIRDTLLMCKNAGIKVVASVIIPAPLETEETEKETFNLLLDVKPDSVNVFFPTLISGTEWDKNRQKYGIEVENPKDLYKKVMVYDVSYLSPPVLWPPINEYKVNEKNFNQIGKENSVFTQELRTKGITTQLLDPSVLLSEFTSMNSEQFGQKTHYYLQYGKSEEMRDIISEINSNITS